MKVLTILGTRPEIIRLSRIIEKLDCACQHIVVHTGQNFDPSLSDIFFDELRVRQPDHSLGIRGETFSEQIAGILAAAGQVLRAEKPDRVLVLGDTNSGLSSVVAKRLGIPVFHMEAGNRCYDDRVPEEVNRRIIDHSSDVLMPYTERSRSNLLREGFASERVFVIGNPINEVIRHYEVAIAASVILQRIGVTAGKYFLVTLHRAENVDDADRLSSALKSIQRLATEYSLPVVCSLHPRTAAKRKEFGFDSEAGIQFHSPFGLFDFLTLERNAFCVLSDSGTVQEECCIFGVPTVTLRDVTERPETIECGSNVLSGVIPDSVVACVRAATDSAARWKPPAEYLEADVSSKVVKLLTGYYRSPIWPHLS